MADKPLSAGDPIEARCTKCRKITNHIVVAMKDAVPAKVECNTCNGQHLYRKPKATAQTAAKKAANAKVAEQKKWLELKAEMEKKSAKKYSMDAGYSVDCVIEHPQFGLGLVQRILGGRKIEVLFEDGLKTMRCK